MAVVVVFKLHLRHRLMGTRLVVSPMGVALGEVTVSEAVLSKEFDVLEDRAVIKCVTGDITCQVRLCGVKRLSSANGVDTLVG